MGRVKPRKADKFEKLLVKRLKFYQEGLNSDCPPKVEAKILGRFEATRQILGLYQDFKREQEKEGS